MDVWRLLVFEDLVTLLPFKPLPHGVVFLKSLTLNVHKTDRCGERGFMASVCCDEIFYKCFPEC